jgi:hypothetical protein
MKSEPGPPMTLAALLVPAFASVVWSRDCSGQVEPDPPEMVARWCRDDGCRLVRAVGLFPLRQPEG